VAEIKKPAPRAQHAQHTEIIIKGAREHNLKDIDLTIPRDKLVVFTELLAHRRNLN